MHNAATKMDIVASRSFLIRPAGGEVEQLVGRGTYGPRVRTFNPRPFSCHAATQGKSFTRTRLYSPSSTNSCQPKTVCNWKVTVGLEGSNSSLVLSKVAEDITVYPILHRLTNN